MSIAVLSVGMAIFHSGCPKMMGRNEDLVHEWEIKDTGTW